MGGVRTPYARIGDAFAWLCVVFLAGMVSIAIVGRARSLVASTHVEPAAVAASSVEGVRR
jgi:hypothetical protein